MYMSTGQDELFLRSERFYKFAPFTGKIYRNAKLEGRYGYLYITPFNESTAP